MKNLIILECFKSSIYENLLKIIVDKDTHSVIKSLKEKVNNAENFFQASHRVQQCLKHPEETLRLYCETTNECICRDCTLGNHHILRIITKIYYFQLSSHGDGRLELQNFLSDLNFPAGEYKNMKVKPISEIIGSHRDNVRVALDAVQSKLKPLNQSISILKDEEHEMKVLFSGTFGAELFLV